jgi:hypothetical protein
MPLRRGRLKTSSQYARSVGALISVERLDRPPLLFEKYRSGKGHRRAAAGADRKPPYIGLSTVAIAKRFGLQARAQKVAAQLPTLYAKHLKED